MDSLFLLIIVLCLSLQHITKKAYNMRTQNGTYTFAFASVSVAALFFIISSKGQFTPNMTVLGYSVAFAATYSLAAVTSLFAIRTGPLSLTSLITAFSLIIPTLYGLFVLGEPIKPTIIAGVVLLAVCLFLIKFEKGEDKKITLKWVLYVALAFAGNGICSTVQKVQQINSGGLYKNEFMIIALVISAVTLFIFAMIFERKSLTQNLSKGIVCYGLCGLGNGVVNLLVLALSLRVAASVMYPIMSAGSITLTTCVSMLVYKEKLSPYQKLGILSGLLSIVMLNL